MTPSATSRLAADFVDSPMRSRSYRLIFAALAGHGTLSREQLSDVTGLKESSLCGRLSELSFWLDVTEGGTVAASGCSVNTYALSRIGRDRWAEATAQKGAE